MCRHGRAAIGSSTDILHDYGPRFVIPDTERRAVENKEITHQKIETATRPEKLSDYRDHYYPKTEILGDDEMRITALGTGMPNARPSQASPSRERLRCPVSTLVPVRPFLLKP
jgi:hypothetical protein